MKSRPASSHLPLAQALVTAIHMKDVDSARALVHSAMGVETSDTAVGAGFSSGPQPVAPTKEWPSLSDAERFSLLCDFARHAIDQLPNPGLAPEMKLEGFDGYHTGGGCMALARFLPDGSYWYVTTAEGDAIPLEGDDVLVGYYDADGDTQFVEDYAAGSFDPEAFLRLVASKAAPRVYDRDGMTDENERRAFVEEQEQDQEAGFAAFQASRQEMTARALGDLLGIQDWEDEEDKDFLVYDDKWWIEVCDDGRHLLVLENLNWITPQDGTLEDLERILFRFTLQS